MNITQSSAIVLGGIGGIGKEISLQLIDRGLKVHHFSLFNIYLLCKPIYFTRDLP